ncbi:MAG: hypothetical protein ACREMY_18705, partial [bacterium]
QSRSRAVRYSPRSNELLQTFGRHCPRPSQGTDGRAAVSTRVEPGRRLSVVVIDLAPHHTPSKGVGWRERG